MSQQFEKLTTLLRELFQLDQPDLDFGFYRVMHAKSAEVTRFLDQDLLPQVKTAFGAYHSADTATVRKELDEALAQAASLGADPESLPKVKALRAKLASETVDVAALEAEVYDHLFSFFRRYYSEGDFLSKRVYKPVVYAIPYEGEEVKLHWANADQYYIKTSEYLRDYAFRLAPESAADPMRVRFRLVDAAEGEHGNVKAVEGKQRVFVLSSIEPVQEVDGEQGKELQIRFEYRPATTNDWPASQRGGKVKPPSQKELLTFADAAVLESAAPELQRWREALARPHAKSDGTPADYSRLRGHLNRYAARNTFDYFIHKDLGGFLRRELDFYIKNEVMHLDDVENETAPRVEQYLSKIKVVRRIAGKIIDFLAQLEDFQKALWLKKKFVVETSWLIRVGCIPEEFYAEIAANDAQREEWVKLFAIDEIRGDLTSSGYSAPLSVGFLKQCPTLVLDSRHFAASFVAKLVGSTQDLAVAPGGVLINSDNFAALSLAQTRYATQVKCVYIDPPYNAKTSEILYKNSYKHSSWLSLLADRIRLAKPFLNEDSVFVCAIDENEQERLGLLLQGLFPGSDRVAVSVVHNPRGIQGAGFSYTHETAYFVHRDGLEIGLHSLDDAKSKPLMKTGSESERTSGRNCFYPIFVQGGKVVGFGSVPPDDFSPAEAVRVIDDDLLEVWPISSSDGLERKWRYARGTVEQIADQLEVRTGRGEAPVVYLSKDYEAYRTVWSEAQFNAAEYGSTLLGNILGQTEFSFPKSIWTVWHALKAANVVGSDWVIDFFGGSGTTGHAVTAMNRADGGQRSFLLVEQADYFDTVLLPRIKKVTYSPEWSEGAPARVATHQESERSPTVVKVIRLESYEDALNNLDLRRTQAQQSLLDTPEAQGADGLREQYMLRYMLDVETRGSQSLLNVAAFIDPRAYKLKVKKPGSDESREVNVDLLETFNWLIGLTVRHLAAPRTFAATFERDTDPDLPKDAVTRLLVKGGRLREDANGPWWFRTVTGTMPDGRKTLVIWRTRPGGDAPEGVEQDNLVLDTWFEKQGYSSKDSEFDLIYVNGGNNLENLKTADDAWKVRTIEEDFHRLMFDVETV